MEDPMETVETLGPVAVMLHLRDSVVYETRNGIAVQWVPLGEGVVDFKAIIAKAKELCPQVPVYIKPITGRPPAILAVWDPAFMQKYRDMRASRLRTLPRAGEERPSVRSAHGDRGRAGQGAGAVYRGADATSRRNTWSAAWNTERRCWTWESAGGPEQRRSEARTTGVWLSGKAGLRPAA